MNLRFLRPQFLRASVFTLFLGTMAICSFNTAWADSPSFTYVGAEYVANGDFDIEDGDFSVNLGLDGFAVNASLELGVFFLQASRFELETDDFQGGRLDDNISTVAGGMTFELPRAQVYGLVRARRDEIDGRFGNLRDSTDGTTFSAEAGVRVNLLNNLELNANAGIPSTDSGVIYGVGAQFFVTNNIGITLDLRSIELEDDDETAKFDTTSIGVRFSF